MNRNAPITIDVWIVVSSRSGLKSRGSESESFSLRALR